MPNHEKTVTNKKTDFIFSKTQPSFKQKKMYEFFRCPNQPTKLTTNSGRKKKSEFKSIMPAKKRKADQLPPELSDPDHHLSSKRVKRTILDHYSI